MIAEIITNTRKSYQNENHYQEYNLIQSKVLQESQGIYKCTTEEHQYHKKLQGL